MKKKVISVMMMCMMTFSVKAQVGPYDTFMQMPTTDLYDVGLMNAYAHAMAATAARRKETFYRYSDLALEACRKEQWGYVIYYVNQALETEYYNGSIYYLRGYAYEQLGNFKQAKKDYRKAKKNGSYQAELALERMKKK